LERYGENGARVRADDGDDGGDGGGRSEQGKRFRSI